MLSSLLTTHACLCALKVEAQQREQSAHSQVFSAADSIAALQQQLAVAAAQFASQQQQLAAAKAAAHAAARAAEAAAAAEHAAAEAQRQAQVQQQQQGQAFAVPQQQQQQQQFVEFDESAAEAQLQPLLLAEQQLVQQLSEQQGITQDLNGQLTALVTRRRKYLSIQGAPHNGNGHVAVATAAAVAAMVPAAGDGAGGRVNGGIAPVCEQCLQPINLDLYQR
jgi:small-conductance mechanosensitive channel